MSWVIADEAIDEFVSIDLFVWFFEALKYIIQIIKKTVGRVKKKSWNFPKGGGEGQKIKKIQLFQKQCHST